MSCPNSARERSCTIAFCCSPEQREMVDRPVPMSGLLKQDYILARHERREIHATPNVSLYKGLTDTVKSVCLGLRRIQTFDQLDERTVRAMGTFADMSREVVRFGFPAKTQALARFDFSPCAGLEPRRLSSHKVRSKGASCKTVDRHHGRNDQQRQGDAQHHHFPGESRDGNLGKGWPHGKGKVDFIAEDEGELVFVVCKIRENTGKGMGAETPRP